MHLHKQNELLGDCCSLQFENHYPPMQLIAFKCQPTPRFPVCFSVAGKDTLMAEETSTMRPNERLPRQKGAHIPRGTLPTEQPELRQTYNLQRTTKLALRNDKFYRKFRKQSQKKEVNRSGK